MARLFRKHCGTPEIFPPWIQLLKRNRLLQIIASSLANRLHRARHAPIRREQNHRRFRDESADALHHLQTVAIRHTHIRHHQLEWAGAKFAQRVTYAVAVCTRHRLAES